MSLLFVKRAQAVQHRANIEELLHARILRIVAADDSRHAAPVQDSAVEFRQSLLRPDLDEHGFLLVRDTIDQVNVTHGRGQLSGQIRPDVERFGHVAVGHAGKQRHPGRPQPQGVERPLEDLTAAGHERRVVRTGDGEQLGFVTASTQQLGQLFQRVASPANHRLIRRVVIRDIGAIAQRRGQLLDQRRRGGGRHERAAGAGRHFNRVVASTRGCNNALDVPDPGGRQRGKFAVTVARDQVWLNPEIDDGRVNDQIG